MSALLEWRRPRPTAVGLAIWTTVLASALVALHLVGRGPLAPPPLTHPAALAGWLGQRSSVTLAFCALRLAAMGLAWYLLATTALGVLARVAGWARAAAVIDALSPAAVRRLTGGAASLTVAATLAGSAAPAWSLADRPLTPEATATGPPASPTPVMHRLSGQAESTGQPVSPDPVNPPAGVSRAPATWLIRPGDNLWSVAEATLARTWGRPPSDAEVDRYWRRLIDLNRARLADPHHADLVFPGQLFQLPPLDMDTGSS